LAARGRYLRSLFTGLNNLPRIALAPLLVIWFGIDMASKVVLAATLVLFLTFLMTDHHRSAA
jgi:NitT/TauT family transport system permease protein